MKNPSEVWTLLCLTRLKEPSVFYRWRTGFKLCLDPLSKIVWYFRFTLCNLALPCGFWNLLLTFLIHWSQQRMKDLNVGTCNWSWSPAALKADSFVSAAADGAVQWGVCNTSPRFLAKPELFCAQPECQIHPTGRRTERSFWIFQWLW